MDFCQFFKEQRKKIGTVRKFSELSGYDPGYISRVENGITLPPKDSEKLKKLGLALGLEPDTKKWRNFTDLAAIAKSEIPSDLKNNPRFVSVLPAFYRTLRNEKLDLKEAEELLKIIQNTKMEE